MSKDKVDQSVTTVAQSSADQVEGVDSKTDIAEPTDLEKRLSATALEAKKFRQSNAELKKKLSELEESKLAESGKWQEAYEKTKTEASDLKKQLESINAKYAFKIVSGQLASHASEMQCVDPSTLIDLLSAKGMLDELEVDQNFNVDKATMKSVLDRAKKQFPYLWGKAAPSVKDTIPRTTEAKEDIDKLPLQEKIKRLASLM